MATNKKITELTELTEIDLSDDDVLAIVDVSAGTTNKIRKSTLASAVAGVSEFYANTPLSVDANTGVITATLGTVPVNKGGTSATDAGTARINLGAAASGANTDITSLGGLTTDIAIADGGTGASDPGTARNNLGLGTISTQASSSIAVTGGTIDGTTIGATTPDEGNFTNLDFTGTFTQNGTAFTSGGGLFKGDNGTTGDAINGPKDIFRINEQELNTDVTITSAENASATGPLSVANGTTLTVDGNLAII